MTLALVIKCSTVLTETLSCLEQSKECALLQAAESIQMIIFEKSTGNRYVLVKLCENIYGVRILLRHSVHVYVDILHQSEMDHNDWYLD